MKRIRAEVIYNVPHWAFCNEDSGELYDVPKKVCRFCVKTKGTRICLLYDQTLVDDDGLVSKAQRCKEATAGYRAVIEADKLPSAGPTVEPRQLIKQTIELYSKNVNSLINQGYPRAIAEQVAKKYMLEE